MEKERPNIPDNLGRGTFIICRDGRSVMVVNLENLRGLVKRYEGNTPVKEIIRQEITGSGQPILN